LIPLLQRLSITCSSILVDLNTISNSSIYTHSLRAAHKTTQNVINTLIRILAEKLILLTISLDCRPNLRIRITLSYQLLLRKSWIYGDRDFHSVYVTHVNILAVYLLVYTTFYYRSKTTQNFGFSFNLVHLQYNWHLFVSSYAFIIG